MSHDFLVGVLVGFGVAGCTVAGIFWIDKVIDFHWIRRRR